MKNVHTPRLCIDGRIASEAPGRGLIAQEVIDQLVAGQGEGEASTQWIEKHRTVLLSHPHQVFSGQLRRHDTTKNIPWEPLSYFWEKRFLSSAEISAFHRFRPIDRLKPTPRCATITTVLPAITSMPFFLSRRSNQFYVVPSQADRRILTKNYQVDAANIFVHAPTIRRALTQVEKPDRGDEDYLLVILGDKDGKERFKKIRHILKDRFSSLKFKVLSLGDRETLQVSTWVKILANTKLCIYLQSQEFDWATLALESLYFGVPTLMTDTHAALNELLPHSHLRLSQFLLDLPEVTELRLKSQTARVQLDAAGAFDPLGLAKRYNKIYEKSLT